VLRVVTRTEASCVEVVKSTDWSLWWTWKHTSAARYLRLSVTYWFVLIFHRITDRKP